MDDIVRNPHQIRQGSAANSGQESRPDSILTGQRIGVGTVPALRDILQIPIELPPKSSLHHLPLHLCNQPFLPWHWAVLPHTLPGRDTNVPIVPVPTLVARSVARSTRRPSFRQA